MKSDSFWSSGTERLEDSRRNRVRVCARDWPTDWRCPMACGWL